ncbi:hypothetical protein ACFLZI_03415 [Nitrospirota bacterium]
MTTRPHTVGELIKAVIKAEKEARQFYHLLAIKFSHHDSSEFFRNMESDEGDHIRELDTLYSSLSQDKLKEVAPGKAVDIIHAYLNYSAEEQTAKIMNLDDAYRMTVNLEFSELNKLKEMMFKLFDEEDKITFEDIQSHLDRLKSFQADYPHTESRQTVKAK